MDKGKIKKSLTETAYSEIKRLMLEQRIVSGQKLLYRELIDLLRMSKTPIINALNRLEQEGFIVSVPNYGFSVKPLDQREIIDSQEVREALECKAVQRAILLGKQADFKILADKLRAYEEYRPYKYDRKKLILNAEFHMQIAAISGNRVLKYLLRRNLEHMILRAEPVDYSQDRMDKFAQDHVDILLYIKKKDISGCQELISKHIQEARDEMILRLSWNNTDDLRSMNFFEEDSES